MRRFISLLLVVVLSVVGCANSSTGSDTIGKNKQAEVANKADLSSTELNDTDKSKDQASEETGSTEEDGLQEEEMEDKEAYFDSLNDPALLQYVEDSVYAGLADQFDSEDYVIENVEASYVSKEYLEELAYNSQKNIWFGFTSAELDQQFQGEKCIYLPWGITMTR